MSKLFKSYFLFLVPVLMVLAISCDDDEAEDLNPTAVTIAPESGVAGDRVVITGTNLEDATVTFGSTPAVVNTTTGTSVDVTVPEGLTPGQVIVTVTNDVGSADINFTVLEPTVLAPTIASITPVEAAVGEEIVIAGENFEDLVDVTFGGDIIVDAADVTATATSLTLLVPEGAVTGPIIVETAGGTVTSEEFTVLPAAPTVTAVDPLEGPVGSEITVTGENLGEVESVMFGDVAATIDTEASTETSLVFTVPEGAVTGPITITTAGGSVDTDEFTVTEAAAPTVTAIDPLEGGAGTVVTVTGENLDNVESVMFGEAVAVIDTEASTATSLVFTVPDDAALGAGVITITTLGGVVETPEFTVTEPVAAPTITAVDPMTGAVGDEVVITGENLDNLESVMIGEIAAVVNQDVSTATSITFTVPEGAASAPISVTTAGGVATTTEDFVVTVADDANATALFDDAINEAWQAWDGWGHSLLEWDNTEQAISGNAIKVTFDQGAWGGIQLHPIEVFSTEGLQSVVVSVFGAEGSGNVMLYIKEEGQADGDIKKVTLDVEEGEWNTFLVPISSLGSVSTGAPATIHELVIQDVGNAGGETDNTYFIDNIMLR